MAAQVATRDEVYERLAGSREAIRACGVERLQLFGSFARGVPGPDSDVDVLVTFAPGKKSYDNFLRLAELLEEILSRKVELLTPEGLSPFIGPHILAEATDVVLDG